MIRASVLTGFAETARTVDLDPLEMLDAVGIPRRALAEPDLWISHAAFRDLLEMCAAAAATDDFGLRMDARRTVAVLGPIALIAREQTTVRGVLEAIHRHHTLHVEATTLPLEDTGELTIVRFIQIWTPPAPDGQCVDLGLAQMMRVLRQHLGDAWAPERASFRRAQPRSLDSHRRVFGPRLAFDQDFNGLICRRADLDRPNTATDPEMARHVGHLVGILGDPAGPGLLERVRVTVLRQFADGPVDAGRAARQLGMDLRTMQRQLAAAGTSFGRIVQETRMGLIPQYLEQSDRSLAEVSELLGFSALSAFSRWHRIHYGVSPSVHRRAARARPRGAHDA